MVGAAAIWAIWQGEVGLALLGVDMVDMGMVVGLGMEGEKINLKNINYLNDLKIKN